MTRYAAMRKRLVDFTALWGLALAVLVGLQGSHPAAASDGGGAPWLVPVDVQVTLPQIDWWVHDSEGTANVNAALRAKAAALIEELAEVGNVWGEHTVQLAQAGIVSVSFHYSAYREPMAHPAHLMGAVTADLQTGTVYSLAELFVDDRYVDLLSQAVAKGIAAQDIPTLIEFEGINPDQEYYLTPDGLVVFFQLYELAPYAWGFPQFQVPYEELLPIAREGGPILRLAGAGR